jgi:hypothetical protein
MSGAFVLPKVQSKAQWRWTSPPAGEAPIALTYPSKNNSTKSGVMPNDLQDFIGIPLTTFNPTLPISDKIVIGWIRYAEDKIEQDTNIRLCQTWIAAPPAKTVQEVLALNIGVQNNYQQLGVDYDFEEPAYDFRFDRAQDEGWLYTHLRWRPVKSVDLADPSGMFNASNLTGTKNIAFIYPLLNEYFRAPQNWIVEDQNRGLVRLVPATNVQMLPLFAMQLAFMGFAESVPGGLWFQYSAGLTANDYNANWSFMTQLVLVRAAIRALRTMQMSINLGVTEGRLQVDGLMRSVKYDARGPFAGQITEYENEEKSLLKTARSKCGMPYMGTL